MLQRVPKNAKKGFQTPCCIKEAQNSHQCYRQLAVILHIDYLLSPSASLDVVLNSEKVTFKRSHDARFTFLDEFKKGRLGELL